MGKNLKTSSNRIISIGIVVIAMIALIQSVHADTGNPGTIIKWGYPWHTSFVTPAGNDFIAIEGSTLDNLALKSDGSIVVWGYNNFGATTPPAGNDYVAIAAGADYQSGCYLALKSDGSIVGWGRNYSGEATPPTGNDFVAIDTGGHHSLALKSDGTIVAWGEATTPSGNDFVAPPGNDYVAISAGMLHDLALKSDGSISAWGYNSYGEGTAPPGNDYVAISAGPWHNLALKSDGSISAWGDNSYGEGTAPPGNDYVAISAGDQHNLALKSDGSIYAWGNNNYGQTTPQPGNDYVAISAGVDYSLAIKAMNNIATPTLTSSLKITHQSSEYHVGDTLTAEFDITNIGNTPITLDKLLVGGRFNDGKLSNNEYPDFTSQSITLQPNVPYHYSGTLTLTEAGNYHFFVAYYIANPTPEEKNLLDVNNWNTNVNLGTGLTDADRIEDIRVIVPPSNDTTPPDAIIDLVASNPTHDSISLKWTALGDDGNVGMATKYSIRYSTTPIIDANWDSALEWTYTGVPLQAGSQETVVVSGLSPYTTYYFAIKTADEVYNWAEISNIVTEKTTDPITITVEQKELFGVNFDLNNLQNKAYSVKFEIFDQNDNPLNVQNHLMIVPSARKTNSENTLELPAKKYAKVLVVFDPLTKNDLEKLSNIKINIIISDSTTTLLKSYQFNFKNYQNIISTNFDITKNGYHFSNADLPGEGLCYGMAATSILYFTEELPIPNNKENTYQIEEEEALVENTYSITWYQKSWTLNRFENLFNFFHFANIGLPNFFLNDDYQEIKNNIQNGKPVIMFLAIGSGDDYPHAVTIYKIIEDGNFAYLFTYDSNFPWNEGYYPSAFSYMIYDLQKQELNYKSYLAFYFVEASKDKYYKKIKLNSPGEIRVYDSNDRLTGVVNGQSIEEIPFSMVDKENEEITIFFSSDEYRYQVVGTSQGTYGLEIESVENDDSEIFTASGIPTSPNENHQYNINWHSLSQGKDGVTVQIDSNGDGVFESTIKADSDLTREEFESPTPIPEFPSAFLPATMIIGFLGAVLLIQRTREN